MLKPRYYQKKAVDDFFDFCADNHGKHPLIVIPTGGGKSFIQALIVDRMLTFPDVRILLITHQKWLIEQNASELLTFLDDRLLNIGIYSAGLKSRDTDSQILFAGIQSVYKKAYEIGFFDLILVDECHRIPQKSMGTYRKFLKDMFAINPKVIIGGLSATPYRMGTGLLTEGDDSIFDDICHITSIPELIDPQDYRNKDRQQYLCGVVSKKAVKDVDVSKVHKRGGEFIAPEMQAAFMAGDNVPHAVDEIIRLTKDRNKVLVFTSGIEHCERVMQTFHSMGHDSACIHSQQPDDLNQEILDAFKNGLFKYLCNVDVLTTGFNEKAIDCICLLRATESPGLYYQMCGRGLRMHPSKTNCLILDFGGNILRHGPIDKIEIKKKVDGTHHLVTAPQKICDNCQDVVPAATRTCPTCGYVFPIDDEAKHEKEASTADILSKFKKPEVYTVENVRYSLHIKEGKPKSLRVEYVCDSIGINKFSEWVCIEHEGFAKKKAEKWIEKRYHGKINTVTEALLVCDEFEKPLKIVVDINEKFPRIISYTFEKKKTKEQIDQEKSQQFQEALENLL